MFKLCIFAAILAVALASAPSAEEAKPAKRSLGYSVPFVAAPGYAYSAPSYAYSAPAYGYAAPAYGYSAPAYAYSAPYPYRSYSAPYSYYGGSYSSPFYY